MLAPKCSTTWLMLKRVRPTIKQDTTHTQDVQQQEVVVAHPVQRRVRDADYKVLHHFAQACLKNGKEKLHSNFNTLVVHNLRDCSSLLKK